MGLTADIAHFSASTSFDDFDGELVGHVKGVLLSGIGMTLAGVTSETSRAVLAYVKECNAAPEVGVIGAGFKTSVEYAVLANGTTSHTTELEDDTRAENMYSVGVFPAVLALGEKMGVSGKEVIETFVVAWDVASKLAIAAQPMINRGLAPWSACATIGVAAGAARLLKLDSDKTQMAIGIAASHASGLFKQVGSGAHLYESGMAGRNGVASAMLARHGLTAQSAVLESPFGYLDAVAGVTEPELKLGHPFRASDIEIKKYPCCLSQMHPIDACVKLISANKIDPQAVKSVNLEVPPSFRRAAALYHHPVNEDEAKFSLAHSLACSFLDGSPWLHRYTNEEVNNPLVSAMRDKITFTYRDDLAGQKLPINVVLTDGTTLSTTTERISDSIFVAKSEIHAKYMRSVEAVLRRAVAEEVAGIVLALEDVRDIRELLGTLTFPGNR